MDLKVFSVPKSPESCGPVSTSLRHVTVSPGNFGAFLVSLYILFTRDSSFSPLLSEPSDSVLKTLETLVFSLSRASLPLLVVPCCLPKDHLLL